MYLKYVSDAQISDISCIGDWGELINLRKLVFVIKYDSKLIKWKTLRHFSSSRVEALGESNHS